MKFITAFTAMSILASGAAFAQSLPTSIPTDTSALTKAVSSSAASEALTVENFDPAVVNQLIDQAPVEDATKTTLKDGVQAAADNPEMLQAALDQVKSALGM